MSNAGDQIADQGLSICAAIKLCLVANVEPDSFDSVHFDRVAMAVWSLECGDRYARPASVHEHDDLQHGSLMYLNPTRTRNPDHRSFSCDFAHWVTHLLLSKTRLSYVCNMTRNRWFLAFTSMTLEAWYSALRQYVDVVLRGFIQPLSRLLQSLRIELV
jgi:hypothetical protein